MTLHPIDTAILVIYVLFAISVGLVLRRRASANTEQYFLSGRQLPWWIAGTSMVATSFAIDTPLLVSGWVRSDGIYQNWLWWCYAISNLLLVFFFARWWRRANVTTKAELTELRYGGEAATLLRGTLGALHAVVVNPITLCWVLLACTKVLEALFEFDNKLVAITIACGIAMTYSLLAGFWGVVMTDLPQFVISVIGAVSLAVIAWDRMGGYAGLDAAMLDGTIPETVTHFWPTVENASFFSGEFWTVGVTTVIIALTVNWWAVESVDGSGTAVQRISASRDERQGTLAVLWYAIAHYSLRPWPWVVVALASLVLLPVLEVHAPSAGTIREITLDDNERPVSISIEKENGESERVSLDHPESSKGWKVTQLGPRIKAEQKVEAGQLLAQSDPELAYPKMMQLLPAGLLGLVIASLLAAFMSTIDTHVNLAASFFVNDIYRRFLHPDGSDRHFVIVSRIASMGVILLSGGLALLAESIRDLFLLFIALLSGLGPVYLLRWFWWRVTAITEIVGMVTSVTITAVLFIDEKFIHSVWELGPLSPDGALSAGGRLILVVSGSMTCSLISLFFTRPDPAQLVAFYRTIRPIGAWGPVRKLAPDVVPTEFGSAIVGFVGGLGLIFGFLFATGYAVLGNTTGFGVGAGIGVVGALLVAHSLRSVPASSESSPS